MEELLKEIINKIDNLEKKTDTGFTYLESKMDNGFAYLENKIDNLESKTDAEFANIAERFEMLDKSNKEGLRGLDKKIDIITEALAQTMEDISDLKTKVEKQAVEIRVIKGGAINA